MNIVFGLLIGAAVGTAQLYLLGRYIKGITTAQETEGSDEKNGTPGYMAAGIIQLLLPFAALVAVAFLYRDALLWAGIGAGTSLIILSIIKALFGKKEV